MYFGRVAETPLPLALYARALAHLLADRSQPAENVLGALGLTMAELEAADAYYNDQLRVSFRRRKGVLAMTFASAFAEARRERGLGGAAPAPEPSPALASAETSALPSYLNPTHSPSPVWRPGMPPPSQAVPAGPVTSPSPPIAQAASKGIDTGTAPPTASAQRPDTPWTAAQVSQRVGKLTVAHFAALTVELSRNPPDPTPILQRYGMSSTDDFAHVHAMFHAQMAVDPAMKAQFESLVTHMRSVSRHRQNEGSKP